MSTDFSPNAGRAAEYAIGLFGSESTFLLMHMYEEPKGGSATAMTDFRDMLKADALNDLKKEKTRLVEKTGISPSHIQILAEYGSGGKELAILARNYGQRVIVLGHIGRSELETVFLGSIAFQTIRNAEMPVLLVPDCELPKATGVMLATSRETPRLSKELEKMNELTKLEVGLLRVVKSPEDVSKIFGKETMLNYSRGDITVEQIVAPSPVEGILSFLDDHPDYMLSLIPHDRGFWQRLMGRGSLTHTLARDAKFPIITWSRHDDHPED